MSFFESIFSNVVGAIEEISRRGTEELSFEWSIPNFPSLLDGSKESYLSPECRIGDERWRLKLCPNWKREERNLASGFVRLGLGRCDFGPYKTFHFSVGIRGSRGVEKIREGVEKFSGYGYSYLWDDFCSRSELVEHETRLMLADTLIIRCVLKRPGAARVVLSRPHLSNQVAPINRSQSSEKRGVLSRPHLSNQVAPINRSQSSEKRGVLSHPLLSNQVAPINRSQSSEKRDACTQTDCYVEAEVLAGVEKSAVKRGCEKVVEDIAKLLDSGEDSDVTVQVGDVEFKVHRNILSARSPVLAAMFRHKTEESASNSIKINDCDPGVFREYLQYLYTGSVHSLTEQTVFDLYSTADKYLAEELKQLCLEHIQATLCVQTFCDTVKLALTHGENDLLQLAIDFAAKNIPSIIRSVEWQHFIREFPTEANEILIKCIKL